MSFTEVVIDLSKEATMRFLHLFRGEAVVVPDDTDYGDIDIRKDIDRHRNDGGNAKDGDEQGHHDEGIGAS
jgi:hypothetical protein